MTDRKMPSITPAAAAEPIFEAAAHGPVLVERPHAFDAVVMSADAYATLIDKVQSVEFLDGDTLEADPMLAELARDAGETS